MSNKYRIDTNWDLNGPRYIYDVIMDLFSELNKSLKTPLMQTSRSNEEVQKILDNPAGITVEELQVINAWDITDKKLRRKVRNKLDWAYRNLSTTLFRLITYRNSMPNRSLEKNNNIDDANRRLKDTIIDQYEEIERIVKNYEAEGKLSGSKDKKKLLTYIRKVYSKALSETVENLFSMATDDTERARIFPFKEQEAFKDKLTELQEKIFSLTQESKEEQKEDYEKLELGKKELEAKLTSLKGTINNTFPNLIDNEDKISEEMRKSVVENLNKLKEIQQQVGEESKMVKKTTERLENLVKEIEQKTSQVLDRVQIRSYLKEVKDNLKGIATELLTLDQQLTAQIESASLKEIKNFCLFK